MSTSEIPLQRRINQEIIDADFSVKMVGKMRAGCRKLLIEKLRREWVVTLRGTSNEVRVRIEDPTEPEEPIYTTTALQLLYNRVDDDVFVRVQPYLPEDNGKEFVTVSLAEVKDPEALLRIFRTEC